MNAADIRPGRCVRYRGQTVRVLEVHRMHSGAVVVRILPAYGLPIGVLPEELQPCAMTMQRRRDADYWPAALREK